MENQVEIWKSYPYISGIEVSTLGRVRTLDRVVQNRNGTRLVKGHVLKPFNSGRGYMQVQFYMNGKRFNKKVHRLVVEAFIPNPDNLPEVNHKNCDRDDNRVENLEWCSRSYNRQYREKYGVSQTEASGHPLFAVNLSTLEVSHFRSQGEAGKALGFDKGNINRVIKGRQKTAYGFWFVNDDGHAVDVVKSKLHDIGGVGLKIKYRAVK